MNKIISKLPHYSIDIIGKLSNNDIMTRDELLDSIPETNSKTIRYALRRLLENKLILQVPNLEDMRTVNYALATPELLSDILPQLSNDLLTRVLDALENHD
ncbi:MAG: hypothetical protein OEZ01_03240 [Candidatus Heimdallarchaeota archaeon]|nr:hypothetical protein [Candidatus Heimdallarchaeota archaeon]